MSLWLILRTPIGLFRGLNDHLCQTWRRPDQFKPGDRDSHGGDFGAGMGIVFAMGEVSGLRSVPRGAWLALLLSAGATGLSGLFCFEALQIGKASYVAPIDKFSVALVFLNEPVTWKAVAGTIAILCRMTFKT